MFSKWIEPNDSPTTQPDNQRNRKSSAERSPSIQLRNSPAPKKLSNRQSRQSHHIFTRRLPHDLRNRVERPMNMKRARFWRNLLLVSALSGAASMSHVRGQEGQSRVGDEAAPLPLPPGVSTLSA